MNKKIKLNFEFLEKMRFRAFVPSRLRAFALSCLRPFVPSPFRAFALSCVFTLFLVGCKQQNRFAIDVNQNRVEVEIKRFDKDLILLDTTQMHSEIERLYQEYPDFFPVFIVNILDIEPEDTLLVTEFIKEFLSDEEFAAVNQMVLKEFKNLSDIEKSLSTAYTYIHHYFPEMALPDVYFFVSGFNLSIMMADNIIAMATDKYLGSDFPLYQQITYRYMLANMNRENIAPDLISALLFREFRMRSEHNRLIDNMLYRGKIMYLLSIFMPDVKDEYLIGYTAEQIKWSKKHERNIWAAMIDQKDLFSSDQFTIRKYLNDAPFTSTISPESPGRLGTWVGWQIVKSYMQRNQHITLNNLVNTTDYQKILEESGYRP